MLNRKYSISFCIVCMNRLHQLRDTLITNISDNEYYQELEFLVLDYNSQDGMEEWVKENMMEYIINGKMVYYKTTEPETFNHSHSKNLAFNLATGEVVCNINADHYTGKGFAAYVNNAFINDDNIVLTPLDFHKTKKRHRPPKDVGGKVCVKKSDFLRIRGFDERMNRYGFEDWDFVNRLELMGIKRLLIENSTYLQFIAHEEAERYILYTDNLIGLYVGYCTPSLSEVVFLYRDGLFEKGRIIDDSTIGSEDYVYAYRPRNNLFEFSIEEDGWNRGIWNVNPREDSISFVPQHSNPFTLKKSQYGNYSVLEDEIAGKIYYRIADEEIITNLMTFNYMLYNRSLMEENLKKKMPVVNSDCFGKATVYKNFKNDFPIII